MSTLDSKVDSIEVKMTDVQAKVTAIAKTLESVSTAIASLDELKNNVIHIKEQVSKHTPILNAMDGLDATIAEISSSCESLSYNLPTLTERVGETNVLVGDMTIATRDCTREVADLGEKIGELAPKIPTMREAIDLVDACSRKIEEYVRTVRAEVVKYMESAGQLNANIENTAEIIVSLRTLSENVTSVISGVYTSLDKLSAKVLDVNELLLKITESIEFRNRFGTASDAIEDITTAALNIKSLFKGRGDAL